MYKENPGADMFKKEVYIVSTKNSAAGMRDAVKKMAPLALKVAKGEAIGASAEEGYLPNGIRKNFFEKKRGAERAVEMLIKKLNGKEFETEYEMPSFDRVAPGAAIKDMSKAKIALVTSGGIVPKGNPDHIESSSASKYGKYDIASEAPFRRISYRDAMETYGSDKPDLRIDLTVQDMTALVAGSEFAPFAAGNTVKAVVVPDCAMARKAIDKLCADVEVQAGSKPYWFKVDEQGSFAGGIAKFLTDKTAEITAALGLKPGCFVGVTAGKKTAAQKAAGVLRTKLGTAVPGHMDTERYEFCWIVDFPMYEIGEESGELEFCHNPFSMPNGGLEILEKAERGEVDPLDIYAYQYDLVCNGVELSSGAVRNHDPEIMVKAFELVRLGEDDVKAKFPAMYNAFCYGAPPHAGIAPGVDRMVMLLAGEDCIREIIPFPMNKNAQDVMMGAPGTVEPHQLEELHIAVVGDTEPDTEA